MNDISNGNKQNNLLCKLTKASSLQQVTDIAYELLGNPVFITDMGRTVLAHTKAVEIREPSWQSYVVDSRLDRTSMKQNRQVGVAHLTSSATREPVLVEDDHISFPRIIKTLWMNNRTIGVMILTAYMKPFGEQDIELMEIISSFVAVRMADGSFSLAGEGKSTENYLIKLLSGAEYRKETMEERMDVLGWKRYDYHYVLVMWSLDDTDKIDDMNSILNILQHRLNCCCFRYNTSIVCIYQSKSEISDWDAQATELKATLTELDLVAGISQNFRSICTLRHHFNQALHSIDIGTRLGRKHLFFTYDAFSVYHLFQQYPMESLSAYCNQKIRELDNYDKIHNSELCTTLQVYFDNARSLSKTAEILFVHRNTVNYRIRKCFDMLDSKLLDGGEFFSIMFSLRLLEYEKKFGANTPLGENTPHPNAPAFADRPATQTVDPAAAI